MPSSIDWHEAIEATSPSAEKSLWIYDPKLGWHTDQGLRQDSQQFASFFAMLERYAPTPEQPLRSNRSFGSKRPAS